MSYATSNKMYSATSNKIIEDQCYSEILPSSAYLNEGYIILILHSIIKINKLTLVYEHKITATHNFAHKTKNPKV